MTTPTTTLHRNGEEWVLVPEAAKRLGVTTGRVYHLITDKRLRTLLGSDGLHYVSERDLGEYERYREQLGQLRRTGRPLAPIQG